MIYDSDREKEDLAFVTKFRYKWFCSREKRLWHRAKWWGCWLRHHRQLRDRNLTYYLFLIMHERNSSTLKAFDYINGKKV